LLIKVRGKLSMLELSKWDLDLETDDQEKYTSLVRAVRRNHQRFKLLFVSCSPSRGEKIRRDLMVNIPTKKYELIDLQESIDNLYEAIGNIPNLSDLDVLFIRGLEYSIFEYEDQEFGDIKKRSQSKVYGGSWAGVPPVLAKLNMQRELFRDRFPHLCFVFLLPHFAIDYFIRRAPDFYDWKSGIYRFETDAEDLRSQITKVWELENYEEYIQLTSEERLAQITEIRACLDEVTDLDLKQRLLAQLGLLQAACKQFSYSLHTFDRSLQIKPDDASVWNNRGIVLRNLGRYEDAIISYDRCLQIKPDDALAWSNRGNALDNLGRYEDAITSYDRCLQIKPDYDKAWYGRGYTLGNLGRYEEAIISYDRCLQIKPDDHAAWYGRGYALGELGRYMDTITSYDRCLELKSDYDKAWYSRGIALGELGRYEDAITSYDRCLQIKSDDDDAAWYSRGNALFNLGRHEDAIASYDRCLQIKPNQDAAWNNRGDSLFNLSRYEEAIASYDRSLEIKPDDAVAWYSRGNALFNLGRYEEAITSYERSLQIKPDDAAWHNKGVTFYRCDKYQESLDAHEHAISIKPDKHDYWHDKGLVLFHLGKYKEALTAWQEALNIISKLKPSDTSNLIQEFLDEQLLPKFQQPAVRDILPQLLTIYTTAQVLPELAVALTRNLKAIQSPTISDYTAAEWLNMWQELGDSHPELALALRMLEAGIKYKQNPTDDRVFLSLPQEMRPLLREALGLEP
jgi:tetratricopeptide (TPR) repeat protein